MDCLMGRHTFKVGADVNHNEIENYFAGNVRGSYTFNRYADYFAGNPASFIQTFPGPGTPECTPKPNFTERAESLPHRSGCRAYYACYNSC